MGILVSGPLGYSMSDFSFLARSESTLEEYFIGGFIISGWRMDEHFVLVLCDRKNPNIYWEGGLVLMSEITLFIMPTDWIRIEIIR